MQAESRVWNAMGQLTSIAWPGFGSLAYSYPASTNNGQIAQMSDTISGETVVYQYNSLKRLTSANSTPATGSAVSPWIESFQYDGFGDLKAKVLNGVTQPMPVNPQTNQMSNALYDPNGNMTSGAGATFTYDEANRLSSSPVSGGIEYYGYSPDNKRIYHQFANGNEEWIFYGARGEQIGKYTMSASTGQFSPSLLNVWFGGRLVATQSVSGVNTRTTNPVYQDRLGTNRALGARYYAYGDEITSTSNDREKFATYTRDSFTGLDYADQRFYASTYGRFNTPDPYQASGGPSDPSSWNRYSYTAGDPVNRFDPRGLDYWDPNTNTLFGDSPGDVSSDPESFLGGHSTYGYAQYFGLNLQYIVAAAQGRVSAAMSIISVSKLSTATAQAVGVQNSLRWIQGQIGQYTDCDNWLSGNSGVIDTLLGQTQSVTTDSVGVGKFSDPTVNAVYGTAGTNLPTDGSALLTVNLNGAYFSNVNVGPGATGINGGSDRAKLFILLHELAHATNAAGFSDGDDTVARQTANNNLLMQNCGTFINSVSN